jgi:hypothetical protein
MIVLAFIRVSFSRRVGSVSFWNIPVWQGPLVTVLYWVFALFLFARVDVHAGDFYGPNFRKTYFSNGAWHTIVDR